MAKKFNVWSEMFTVENIPVNTNRHKDNRGRKVAYPFEAMKVGQSFTVERPLVQARQTVYYANRKLKDKGKMFAIEKDGSKVRIGRVK